MFEYHDRFAEAAEHLAASRTLFEALPSDQPTAQSADESVSRDAELGITLAKIGLLHLRMGNLGHVEPPIMKCLALIRGVGHPFYEMTAMLHLASYYLAAHQAGRALANLEACLGLLYEFNLQHQHTRRLAQIWGLMAQAYLAHHNKAMAKHFTQKAITVIDGLSKEAQGPLRKDIQLAQLRQQLLLQ